jgi:hypothetical protein
MQRRLRAFLVVAVLRVAAILGVCGIVSSVLIYGLSSTEKTYRAGLWINPGIAARRTLILHAEISREDLEFELKYYAYSGPGATDSLSYSTDFSQFLTQSHHVSRCGTFFSHSSDGSFSSLATAAWLPPWPLGVISLVPVLPLLIVRWRRNRRRARAGLCLACGYDLRSSGGVCSECGRPRDPGGIALAH